MRIVLYAPDIPQNVGSVARTCAVTGSSLTLVRPITFPLTSSKVKRAGLDYWDNVSIDVKEGLEEALEEDVFYFLSTKGKKIYTDIPFTEKSTLVFGSESAGLPPWVHERWPEKIYTIPMRAGARSLNLSNAVAVVLYEGLRQLHFKSDEVVEQLH